ncbi:MAG: twin-arginine translocase TatA/TatE family subunit [Alphaproteobacteria bacterium]|nr:twin-arginine translocase TatA/TatE family subunit [Alphaproteobacteria bacterium]
MGPSIWHILVVLLLVFLIFGAGRLPRVMEDIAKGIKGFKKGMTDEEDPKQIHQTTDTKKD